MRFDTIWPIVDRKTCGTIDGFPRPDQMVCFCFESGEQARVARALNLLDAIERINKTLPKLEARPMERSNSYKDDDFNLGLE
jgi:hypothetical protein